MEKTIEPLELELKQTKDKLDELRNFANALNLTLVYINQCIKVHETGKSYEGDLLRATRNNIIWDINKFKELSQ